MTYHFIRRNISISDKTNGGNAKEGCKTMNKQYKTFILELKDGTKKPFYCKKNELENYMTIKEYKEQARIYILPTGDDTTPHKDFTVKI